MNQLDLVEKLVSDRADLRRRLDVHWDTLAMLLDLECRGYVKILVTEEGLSTIAEDGLVAVEKVRHVQDCEVVRLAARGSRSQGPCTCGSVPR